MGIYTRKGDGGLTQLADGKSVSKTDPRIALAGELDELNSHLGLLLAAMEATPCLAMTDDAERIGEVQRHLFRFGAWAVSPGAPNPALTQTDALVADMERAIDRTDAALGGLFRGFVLPGGHPAAAQAHVARSVCRRVERSLLAGFAANSPGRDGVATCLNRLSDYLFAVAKKINAQSGVREKK